MATNLDEIDFMSDSLSMFGDVNGANRDDGVVRYGPLVLNIPPKASTLTGNPCLFVEDGRITD